MTQDRCIIITVWFSHCSRSCLSMVCRKSLVIISWTQLVIIYSRTHIHEYTSYSGALCFLPKRRLRCYLRYLQPSNREDRGIGTNQGRRPFPFSEKGSIECIWCRQDGFAFHASHRLFQTTFWIWPNVIASLPRQTRYRSKLFRAT